MVSLTDAGNSPLVVEGTGAQLLHELCIHGSRPKLVFGPLELFHDVCIHPHGLFVAIQVVQRGSAVGKPLKQLLTKTVCSENKVYRRLSSERVDKLDENKDQGNRRRRHTYACDGDLSE